MCDNCKTGLITVQKDMREEAMVVLELIQKIIQSRNNITLKMVLDILQGRKLQKCYINNDIVSEFTGKLKSKKESDLRRMMI
jgi:superfamily II DNA helicase RecQ